MRTDLAKAVVLTMDSSSHIHLMALWRRQVVASPVCVGAQHALSHTASCRGTPAMIHVAEALCLANGTNT